MAKQAGLGDNLYLGGYNISGDIQSVGTLAGGFATLDFNDITQLAMAREGGLRDGRADFVSYFDDAANRAHAILSTLPRTDTILSYLRSQVRGAPAACINCKQVGYDGNRSQDGAFVLPVSVVANSYGLDWCVQLTAGDGGETVTGAGNTTGVDFTAASTFGLQAYLQVIAFSGTDATIRLQESSDNGAGDAYANVTGGAFTQVTAAHTMQRIATGTQNVERWLRVNVATSGGFSSMTFAVMVCRNPVAVTF